MFGSPVRFIKAVLMAMLMAVLLAGCGVERSKLTEDPDFTVEEFNNLVSLLLKRFDIPLVKNIGFAELPSMGLSNGRTDWLAEHNLLPFNSFDACGTLCNELQRNGYVSEFVPAFDQTVQEVAARADLISVYYGPNVSQEIDTQAYEENRISPNYRSCIITPFNQVFRVYLCAQAGNFHYAYAIKSVFLKEKRELDYANATGDGRFTVEGFVAWYDFYDWAAENSNRLK